MFISSYADTVSTKSIPLRSERQQDLKTNIGFSGTECSRLFTNPAKNKLNLRQRIFLKFIDIIRKNVKL